MESFPAEIIRWKMCFRWNYCSLSGNHPPRFKESLSLPSAEYIFWKSWEFWIRVDIYYEFWINLNSESSQIKISGKTRFLFETMERFSLHLPPTVALNILHLAVKCSIFTIYIDKLLWSLYISAGRCWIYRFYKVFRI